ncbi:MAG TPA: hypothetical protein VK808_12485, partial [Bacteroidia bacterium]|nr:hypothetical protein [Bacteroidia bacterium]
MKKLYFIFIFTLGSSLFMLSKAQNPTYQQKLFYTCKVWGFVKYYHSNVSTCGVNWDSVLLHCLPLVKSAVTQNDFNNVLDTMLNAAGPMALTSSPPCDTMAPELKRNLNFSWINDPMLRSDVQTILDTINNNFRPHAECWVQNNSFSNSNISDLIFPYDSLMLNQNFISNYPDEWQRLLVLFKHWNIVNYFSFNIYIHDIPWDSTLMQNVLAIDNAPNDDDFNIAFLKISSEMDDTHTQLGTIDYISYFPSGGNYSIPLVMEYLYPNYVVTKSYYPNIKPGDIITSLNGLTTQQWEDSLKPYMTGSDTSATRYLISEYMATEPYGTPVTVGYKDSLNNSHSVVLNCDSNYGQLFYDYYPNDTLASAHWRYWSNCNIGYVNVGQIQTSDESALYATLQSANAIIFDVRNYPSSSAIWDIISMMFPGQTNISKLTFPDVTYPGTWYWQTEHEGYNGNPNPYTGQVIILMDQSTISQAEYVCQTLAQMPNAVKVGSQTRGADGNVT